MSGTGCLQSDNKSLLLALSLIKGIGNKTLFNIFNQTKELGVTSKEFWNLPKSELATKFHLKPKLIDAVAEQKKNLKAIDDLLKELNHRNVEFITFDEANYPKGLKSLKNPPFILYCFGNKDLLKSNSLAIVGSRNMSSEGLAILYNFSKALLNQGLTIVEGSRTETDEVLRIASEETKGAKIFVLSDGILIALKRFEKSLKEFEPTNNLFISFVAPELHWTPYGENEKNRIVFALTNNILIIEARKEGIILREGLKALEQKKKVFVVRYEDYLINAMGNKDLITKGGIPISPLSSDKNLKEIVNAVRGEMPKATFELKKELGQFFTPITVVEFMYSMVKLLWNNKTPEKPKIIDPACGEGIFLKFALDQGLTVSNNLYGCDIDPEVTDKWNGLQIRNKLRLAVCDGLLDYKELGVEQNKFDLVIGNPPYGGTGLKEFDRLISEHQAIVEKQTEFFASLSQASNPTKPLAESELMELKRRANAILTYELWNKGKSVKLEPDVELPSFFGDEELKSLKPSKKRAGMLVKRLQENTSLVASRLKELSKEELRKLVAFPIEVLFLERFVQFAKPGGLIGIIIPDGILANINLRYIQEWLFEKTQVLAIISLPRETFKYIGTTAKTSILFLRKLREGETSAQSREIFMASAEYVGLEDERKNDLPEILEKFRKFIPTINKPDKFYKYASEEIKSEHMSPLIVKGVTGEMMLKAGRMDPEYWDLELRSAKLIHQMKTAKFKLGRIGEFLDSAAQGDVPRRKYKERYVSPEKGIKFITAKEVKFTGLDLTKAHYIMEKHDQRIKRARPKYGDVIFVRSGVASIGESTVFLYKGRYNVNSSIDVLRFSKINSFYVNTFLKTKFGKQQIKQLYYGVGTVNISIEKIGRIRFPILSDSFQQRIEKEYKRMSRWHDKAMEVKKTLIDKGLPHKEVEKDSQYQEHIQKAETMLKDLIKKTEEVIEGGRKSL